MKLQSLNWIPIYGDCKVDNGVLRYSSTIIDSGPNAGQAQVCVMKSNLEFENGSITFRTVIKDPASQVQIGFNHGNGSEVFAGLNCGGAAYGVSTFYNNKWENFATVGFGTNPPQNVDILIKVSVTGSELNLFVNGVHAIKGNYSVRRGQISFLLSGKEDVEVELVSVEKSESIAFVVMQFTNEFNDLYREVIEPTCSKFGLKSVRADDIYNNGLIVEDIARSIREATIVIADITPDNLNVYYEVGFSHGILKPTILLAEKKREKLPFDLGGFRTIFYDNTIGGKSLVEEKLIHHLKSIITN